MGRPLTDSGARDALVGIGTGWFFLLAYLQNHQTEVPTPKKDEPPMSFVSFFFVLCRPNWDPSDFELDPFRAPVGRKCQRWQSV